MYKRVLTFTDLKKNSCFLWGPRQTGKSTLLRETFPGALVFDFLLSRDFERLMAGPDTFRQECLQHKRTGRPVVVDEVQRLPNVLNDVQWLIVNEGMQFVLCGSSARKIKRGAGNLLGGRALRYELFPLVSAEIPRFDLLKALNNGLLPAHYDAQEARPHLESYIGDYLKEEIFAEALVRSAPSFHRFLEAAAFSNGEMVNNQNIASECGVSGPTVKQYFQILEDTLLGRFIEVYRRRPKRRVIQSPKFYFFDVGVANYLLRRGRIEEKSESFGKAFEHFIFQELVAHTSYSRLRYPLSTWRTASQLEVDFILGESEVAVEVKGTDLVRPHHARGLAAFSEEYKTRRKMIVSLDARPRKMGDIEVLPWNVFLDQLWAGQIMK
jgi:predicted AAA+ superfamily ATPase